MGDCSEKRPFNRYMFAATCLIYAFSGSPTPDGFELVEIVVLVGLVLSLSPLMARLNTAGIVLTIYGLSIPLIAGFVQGENAEGIVRDLVPFLFLVMPVLYSYRRPDDPSYLAGVIAAVGFIFSVRHLIAWRHEAVLTGAPPDLLYLANSPEVLFAFVILVGAALSRKKIIPAVASLVPLAAMATALQRATFAYIAILGAVVFYKLFLSRPALAILAAILCVSILFLIPFAMEIFSQMIHKTKSVGLNSRVEEWKAVLSVLFSSPWHLLFGAGWGAELENPAVGGLRVSYTHSLLSSLLLKTGLMGCILFLIYLYGLIRRAWSRLWQKPVYFYALSGPLLIGLTLYASYKSLGFGLLLMLLASLFQAKKLDVLKPPVS